MEQNVHLDSSRRHDFVFLFDITDGNPNGDPDAGNLPRTDPENQHGIVTDVCIKRKIRNYVEELRGTEDGYWIFVQNRGYLVDHKRRVYNDLGIPQGDNSQVDKARREMCRRFFDVRTFGGVLVGKKAPGQRGETGDEEDREQLTKKSKKGDRKDEAGGYNCGQVRGPMQLSFARSIDPVLSLDLTITRVALEHSGEAQRVDEESEAPTGTMGRKPVIPYGLYRGYGFYNPYLAEKTGFNAEDLQLFWKALEEMWRLDVSSARQQMYIQGLGVFSHESKMGNAAGDKLFATVQISKNTDPPRCIAHYNINWPSEGPMKDFSGVVFTRLV